MNGTCVIGLRKDSGRNIIRRVSSQYDWEVEVEVPENGG
jgi:hypothetical protein